MNCTLTWKLPSICLWGKPAVGQSSSEDIKLNTKDVFNSSKPGPNMANRGSFWMINECKNEVTAPYIGRLDFKDLLVCGQHILYLYKIVTIRKLTQILLSHLIIQQYIMHWKLARQKGYHPNPHRGQWRTDTILSIIHMSSAVIEKAQGAMEVVVVK